jgi:hypothetical protein
VKCRRQHPFRCRFEKDRLPQACIRRLQRPVEPQAPQTAWPDHPSLAPSHSSPMWRRARDRLFLLPTWYSIEKANRPDLRAVQATANSSEPSSALLATESRGEEDSRLIPSSDGKCSRPCLASVRPGDAVHLNLGRPRTTDASRTARGAAAPSGTDSAPRSCRAGSGRRDWRSPKRAPQEADEFLDDGNARPTPADTWTP